MDIRAASRRLFENPFLRPILVPLSFSVVLVVLFSTILSNFFQVGLHASGLTAEIIVGALLGCWLYLLLRPLWLYLVMQTLLVGLLYMSNALKIDFFAAPVLPGDVQNLPVLLAETSGWRFLLMILPLLAVPLLFLAGLRPRWRSLGLLVGAVVLWVGMFELAPGVVDRGLDSVFGYKPFDQMGNFTARGPSLSLLNEYARAQYIAGHVPSKVEVGAALKLSGLPQPLPAPSASAPRDVYIFMMETLWDPSLLKSVHFTRDPLAPGFRTLWEQSGESKLMVPVFGGGTPNTEFEVLCGIPAYQDAIVFVTTLHRPIECLPHILARLGFRTDAATPDDYGLWNRGKAFRLLGFQRFYDAANFDASDRNGEFMANAPLFDQVDALLAKEDHKGPKLIYISTDSGHYPFELNTARRPALISSDSKDALLTAYANVVYYDSSELADYIARIRARDPDALILAFGDHLPVLGKGLQDYVRSGFMSTHRQYVTPQMVEATQSTPVLLIDGRRGPLKLNHISAFELPRTLLSLLGVQQPVLADAIAPPAHVHPRPFGGRLLQVDDDGRAVFCGSDARAAGCQDLRRWSDAMQTLRADLLAGSDYTQAALYGANDRQPSPDDGLSYLYEAVDAQPCGIKVLSWGPPQTRFGHGFNKRLKSGDSVFFITYQGKAAHPRVWLGPEELQVNPDGEGGISASLTGSLPLYLLGEHDLTLACNGDPARIKVGEFHVRLY
ncbi:MAG TPA: LTA synthase family protein [Gammaproteobacteria bacterium]|jgi:hypothetical protein